MRYAQLTDYAPIRSCGGLRRLPSLKFYNIQKQERRLILGLNAGKNAHYVKLKRIQFRTKKSVGAFAYLPWRGARGSTNFHFRNIKIYKTGKVDSL